MDGGIALSSFTRADLECLFDCKSLSIRWGKVAREPVYIALGIKPDGKREILGFWLFGAEGESSHNWQDMARALR